MCAARVLISIAEPTSSRAHAHFSRGPYSGLLCGSYSRPRREPSFDGILAQRGYVAHRGVPSNISKLRQYTVKTHRVTPLRVHLPCAQARNGRRLMLEVPSGRWYAAFLTDEYTVHARSARAHSHRQTDLLARARARLVRAIFDAVVCVTHTSSPRAQF